MGKQQLTQPSSAASSATTSAAYQATGVAAGATTHPTFALDSGRVHDADGVDVTYSEPSGSPRFTINNDGIYAISYYAEGDSPTADMGAYVQFFTAADVHLFDLGAEVNPTAGDGEAVATISGVLPLSAGEYFHCTLFLNGVTQDGSLQAARVFVTRLA